MSENLSSPASSSSTFSASGSSSFDHVLQGVISRADVSKEIASLALLVAGFHPPNANKYSQEEIENFASNAIDWAKGLSKDRRDELEGVFKHRFRRREEPEVLPSVLEANVWIQEKDQSDTSKQKRERGFAVPEGIASAIRIHRFASPINDGEDIRLSEKNGTVVLRHCAVKHDSLSTSEGSQAGNDINCCMTGKPTPKGLSVMSPYSGKDDGKAFLEAHRILLILLANMAS